MDFLVYPWLWRGNRRRRRRCLGLCSLGGLDRGSVLGMGSRRMGELKGCCGPWWAGTREVRGCVAYIYNIFITLTNTCSSSSPPPSSLSPALPAHPTTQWRKCRSRASNYTSSCRLPLTVLAPEPLTRRPMCVALTGYLQIIPGSISPDSYPLPLLYASPGV